MKNVYFIIYTLLVFLTVGLFLLSVHYIAESTKKGWRCDKDTKQCVFEHHGDYHKKSVCEMECGSH